jgi:nicotinate dehydrogenase medium molybdopterin subunit
MRDIDYLAPKDLPEAIRLLATLGPEATVVAGGTDVVVSLKERMAVSGKLIDIGRLDELHFIEERGALVIGALATMAELAASPEVKTRAQALAEAAKQAAGPPVRNLATIGGNLGTASPAGDLICALVALEARVVLASATGTREVSAEEFSLAPKKHCLAAGELIKEIVLPALPAMSASAFQKLGKRRAMSISVANAAAAVTLSADGKRFEKVRVSLGSVAPTVVRATAFEAALTGAPASLETIGAAASLVKDDITPITDARATAEYRVEVACVLARRAVEDALARAGGLDLTAHRAAAKKRGKGIAGALYSMTPPGFPNPTAVNLQMREDGSVVVQIGIVDMGQGSTTVLTQMTAEAFTIPYEHVTVYTADTGTTPYDFGTVSSRGTFVGGKALLKAAEQVKAVLFEAAAMALGAHPDNLVLEGGFVVDRYDPDRRIPVGGAARTAHFGLKKLAIGSAFFYPKSMAPGENSQGDSIAAFYYHATVAEVEVDTETGVTEVTKLCAAVDCGRAINPSAVEGQVHGGSLQAVGWALREDGHPGLMDSGRPPTDYDPDFMPVDLEAYAIATSMDMPEMYGSYVEVPDPEGPWGAKAAGEICANSGAPAVFNAIYDAVGVRLFDMPATPEKVLWALREKTAGASVGTSDAASQEGAR